MALINCPECGKENVSDSAESCPECGYGIRAHFEKIKHEEETTRSQQIELDSIIMPKEPKRELASEEKIMVGVGAFLLLVTVILFASELYLFCILLLIVGIWILLDTLIRSNNNYKKALYDYELAMNDFEKYQKQKLQEQHTERLRMKRRPKCPSCGSYNVVHISNMDRMASVAMLGVASGKIGKQYKCKSCNYMW